MKSTWCRGDPDRRSGVAGLQVKSLNQLGLATLLKCLLQETRQVKGTEKERKFLLGEINKVFDDQEWWSDAEWERFLNRTLDFLGVKP